MPNITLELSDQEATYLADILQMWIEGIEGEIPKVSTEDAIEAHWALYGLRSQFTTAQSMRMRLVLSIHEKGIQPT